MTFYQQTLPAHILNPVEQKPYQVFADGYGKANQQQGNQDGFLLKRVKQLQDEIQQLRDQLAKSNERNAALEAEITQKYQQIQQIQQQNALHVAQIAKLNKRCEAAEAKVRDQQSLIDSQTQQSQLLVDEHELLQSRGHQQLDEIQELKVSAAEQSRAMQELERQLVVFKDQIKRAEVQDERRIADVQLYKNRCKSLVDGLLSVQRQVQQIKIKVASVSKVVSLPPDLQQIISLQAKLHSSVTAMGNNSQVSKQECLKLTNQVQEFQKASVQRQNELQLMDEKYQKELQQNIASQSLVAQLQSAVHRQELEKELLTKSVQELNSQVQQMQQLKDEQTLKLQLNIENLQDVHKENLNNHLENTSKLQLQLNDQIQQNLQLQNNVKILEKQIEQQCTDNDDKEKQIVQLQQNHSLLYSQIAEIELKLQETGSRCSYYQLQYQISLHDSQITDDECNDNESIDNENQSNDIYLTQCLYYQELVQKLQVKIQFLYSQQKNEIEQLENVQTQQQWYFEQLVDQQYSIILEDLLVNQFYQNSFQKQQIFDLNGQILELEFLKSSLIQSQNFKQNQLQNSYKIFENHINNQFQKAVDVILEQDQLIFEQLNTNSDLLGQLKQTDTSLTQVHRNMLQQKIIFSEMTQQIMANNYQITCDILLKLQQLIVRINELDARFESKISGLIIDKKVYISQYRDQIRQLSEDNLKYQKEYQFMENTCNLLQKQKKIDDERWEKTKHDQNDNIASKTAQYEQLLAKFKETTEQLNDSVSLQKYQQQIYEQYKQADELQKQTLFDQIQKSILEKQDDCQVMSELRKQLSEAISNINEQNKLYTSLQLQKQLLETQCTSCTDKLEKQQLTLNEMSQSIANLNIEVQNYHQKQQHAQIIGNKINQSLVCDKKKFDQHYSQLFEQLHLLQELTNYLIFQKEELEYFFSKQSSFQMKYLEIKDLYDQYFRYSQSVKRQYDDIVVANKQLNTLLVQTQEQLSNTAQGRSDVESELQQKIILNNRLLIQLDEAKQKTAELEQINLQLQDNNNVHQQDKLFMQQKIDHLEEQVQSKVTDNQNINYSLSQLLSEQHKLQDSYNNIQNKNSQLQEQCRQLQLLSQKQELDKIQAINQYQVAQQSNSQLEKSLKLIEEQLDLMQRQNEDLQQKNQLLFNDNLQYQNNLQQIEKQLIQSKQINDGLVKQLSQEANEHKNQIKQIEQQLKNYQDYYNQQQDETTQYCKKITLFQQTLQSIQETVVLNDQIQEQLISYLGSQCLEQFSDFNPNQYQKHHKNFIELFNQFQIASQKHTESLQQQINQLTKQQQNSSQTYKQAQQIYQSDVANLQQLISQLNQRLLDDQQNISNLDSENLQLQNQIKQQEKLQNEEATKQQFLQQTIEQLKFENLQHSEQLKLYQQQIQQKSEQIKALKIQLSDENMQYLQQQDQLKQLQLQSHEIIQNSNQLNEQLKTSQIQANQYISQIQDRETDISNLQKQLQKQEQESQQKYQKTFDNLQSQCAQNEQLQNEKNIMQQTIDELNLKLTDNNQYLQNLQQSTQQSTQSLDQNINILKNQLLEQQNETQQLTNDYNQKILNYQNQINELQQSLNGIKDKNSELENQLKGSQQQNEYQNNQFIDLQKQFDELQQQNESLQNQSLQIEEQLATFQQQKNEQEQQYSKIQQELQQKISGQQGQNSNLHQTINQQNITITELQNQVEELNKTLIEKEDQLKQLQQKQKTNLLQNQKNQIMSEQLKKENELLTKTVGDQSNAIETLQGAAAAASMQLIEIQPFDMGKLDFLYGKISRLEKSIANLTSQNKAKRIQLMKLTKQLEAKTIAKADTSLVDSLKLDNESLTEQVKALQFRIDGLEQSGGGQTQQLIIRYEKEKIITQKTIADLQRQNLRFIQLLKHVGEMFKDFFLDNHLDFSLQFSRLAKRIKQSEERMLAYGRESEKQVQKAKLRSVSQATFQNKKYVVVEKLKRAEQKFQQKDYTGVEKLILDSRQLLEK